ncbi:MAG TPA: hypothetical protein VIF14_13850 [Alphaproteobacteria bacterium]
MQQSSAKQILETSQELIETAKRLWSQAQAETDPKKKEALHDEAKRVLNEARKLAGLKTLTF